MGCTYGAKLNSLWSIWYCIIVVTLHVYIIYGGIERYKLYAELHWPPGQTPNMWLIIYGCIHAAVVCLQPVFIACAVFKVGNLASDNEILGLRYHDTLAQTSNNDCCSRRLRSMWMHSPPMAQSIHAICALGLLLAQQFMLAQLYRVGFVRTSDAWSTELDVFFRRPSLLRAQLPHNLTSVYRIPLHALEPAVHSQAVAIRLVPLLANQHIYGIPLEFVNYVVSLVSLAIVYPNVFWRASKSFSLVFTLHMTFHMVNAVFAYIGMSLLLRVHMTGVRIFMGHSEAPFLLARYFCLIPTYLMGITATFMASICVYGYGYNKFFLSYMSRKHDPAEGKDRERSRSMTRSVIQANAASLLCCEGYGAHISAIVLLVVMVGLKAPMMYDLMVLYQHQSSYILFACIVSDVSLLFWWIILWLLLTLRRDWPFVTQLSVVELINVLRAHRLDDDVNHAAIDESALMLVVNDDAYYTSDSTAKHSILREAYNANMPASVEVEEEERWTTRGSTNNRRGNLSVTLQHSGPHEENGRLLSQEREAPRYQPPGGYQQPVDRQQEIYAARRAQQQQIYEDYVTDGESTPRSFATLPHGGARMQQAQYSTVQRGQQNHTPQRDDFVGIHQDQMQGGDTGHYGHGNYGRPTPPHARVIAVGSNAANRQQSIHSNTLESRTYGTYKPPSSVHSSSSHLSRGHNNNNNNNNNNNGGVPTFTSFGGSRDTTPMPPIELGARTDSDATLTPSLVTNAAPTHWQTTPHTNGNVMSPHLQHGQHMRNDSANFSLTSSESANTITRRGGGGGVYNMGNGQRCL